MAQFADLFVKRMKMVGLDDVKILSEKSFVDEEIIEKICAGELSLSQIDDFDFDLLCSTLKCEREYFCSEEVRKNDILSASLNRGEDDPKTIKIKLKLQEFMNDFIFLDSL